MATVLVIHAHPDDEVFATAGWMMMAVARGDRVVNLIATGGEASELRGEPGDHAAARARRLTRFEQSLAVLGSSAWEWLSGAGRWIDGNPQLYPTVAGESLETLSDAVGIQIARHSPELILSVGLDGLTSHPDHVQIARAVVAAVRQAGRPRAGAWGARLRSADVTAARAHLRVAFGLESIGSGRVVGTADRLDRLVLDAPLIARRRLALDAYAPGLGKLSLPDLLAVYPARGDSLLLRALFDSTGWASEYYSDLCDPDRSPVPGPATSAV